MNKQFLFLFFLLPFSTIAQSVTTDLESWTGFNLEYKVNKFIEINLEEQLRLKDNLSAIDNFFFQPEVSIDVFKFLTWKTAYRFIRENDNTGKVQGYENHNRFQTDLEFEQDIRRLTLKLRARYQYKKEFGPDIMDAEPNQAIRYRLKADYNIRKWKLDPEFSAEIFRTFRDPNQTGNYRYRLFIGSELELSKKLDLGFAYGYSHSLNSEDVEIRNIASLGLKYSIN